LKCIKCNVELGDEPDWEKLGMSYTNQVRCQKCALKEFED